MKIALCGVSSNYFNLFLALRNYFLELKHEVLFVEPDYSGAIVLKHKSIDYKELKRTKRSLNKEELEQIKNAISYELRIMELNHKSNIYKRIKESLGKSDYEIIEKKLQ